MDKTINLGGGKTATIEGFDDIDLDAEQVYVNGERLTEAAAEALARDILSRLGRAGGRPRLAPEGTANLNVRVPISLRDSLRAKAAARGIKESDLVREALTELVAA
jgi:predicted HicB family RNase H-like nuclease